ncbi:E3 ubiquitin-protein ligase siah2 [Phlebotomus argentipes]|uniref:E3 ubiquitin-protein ligase siah2 n=1 Tax=Phlebotomus argentipes TaxID=94469 RepID=UPI002893635F|nr:E3 ubiquitin-protein ligase siah2 [Phlebotomus argentipes]
MEVVPSSRSSSGSSQSSASECSKRNCYVSLKHYDCLLGELRCPGCARPMHAPILLCQSGHSVCQECVRTQKWCPLCREDFTDIRSLTLEAISAKAYFSCKYANHGCSVRLPFELMKWHKPRCQFQAGSCFMGSVWGGCGWSGRKMDYMQHCADTHSERFFRGADAELSWSWPPRKTPSAKDVIAVYMFSVFGEVFDLYQVHNRTAAMCLWTMVCESKERKASTGFAFQIELFCRQDPSRLLVQRHSCHSELDEDLLDEAHCVCIANGDVMRFMGDDKEIHYRVKILDMRECLPMPTSAVCQSCPPKILQNGEPEPVECTNHKCVPMSNIITRKQTKKITTREGIQSLVQSAAKTFSNGSNGSVSSLGLDATEETILTQPMKIKVVNGAAPIDVSNRDLKGIFSREFQTSVM